MLVIANQSPGVSFGSGTIGVGGWARATGARNNKKAMDRTNIGEFFTPALLPELPKKSLVSLLRLHGM
jgi:hypothetical protein